MPHRQTLKQLRYHELQTALYRTEARFPVVCAGRRSGKTEIARRRTIRALAERISDCPNPMYFYGLPTYKQARRVAWRPLLKLIPERWIKEVHTGEMYIETVFGSELHVVGLDRPQRIEGSAWCGGIIDECSDQRPRIFDLTVRPALTDYEGWCWRIGVPKRFGIGAVEFKTAYDLGLSNKDPDIKSFHWMSETVIPQKELDAVKISIDKRDYNEQYRANWEKTSGLIFHAFDEDYNVTPRATYQHDVPIVVGSDFNVNPMCWVLGHLTQNGIIIFDELFIRNTNTAATLKALRESYPNDEQEFWFHGDATAGARKTSASESDYIQIKNSSLFPRQRVFYLKSNPPRANRFASCNALFCNAKDERRLFIHPRCKRLIADLNKRSFKTDSSEPDDSHPDMGHMSDALGYLVYRRFPLRIIANTPAEVKTSAA